MVLSSVRDSLAFWRPAFTRFRFPTVSTLTHLVQTYFSWNMWRGRGRDQVDWGHGEPPTLYDTGFLLSLQTKVATFNYFGHILSCVLKRCELSILGATSISRISTGHRPLIASPTSCSLGAIYISMRTIIYCLFFTSCNAYSMYYIVLTFVT